MSEQQIDMTYRNFNYDLTFKLRTIREKLNFNLREMSAKTGIEMSIIRAYESGKRTANLLYVQRLISETNLELDDLFLDTKDFLAKLWFT